MFSTLDEWHSTAWGDVSRQREPLQCRVCKGTGSQSVVVCVAKYPGGKSWQWVSQGPAEAVWNALKYQQLRVWCTLSLAVFRAVCMGLRYSKAMFILIIRTLTTRTFWTNVASLSFAFLSDSFSNIYDYGRLAFLSLCKCWVNKQF